MNISANTLIKLLSFFGVAAALGVFFFHAYPKLQDSLPRQSSSQKKNTVTNQEAFMAHSLKPIVSNQWFSTLYDSFPTQPLFAMPLAYKLSSDGLTFSYPETNSTEKTIYAPFIEDFTAGTESKFAKPEITDVGDWHVGISLPAKQSSLSFTLTRGVPFTVLHATDEIRLHMADAFTIYTDNNDMESKEKIIETDAFVLKIRNHNYIIAFPEKKTIHVAEKIITIPVGDIVFVGLLDDRKHFDDFKKMRTTEVVGTQMNFSIDDTSLITTYEIYTNGIAPLVALFPHHYENTDEPGESLGTYNTLRGSMHLIQSNQFTTRIPMLAPPDEFAKLAQTHTDLRDSIKKDIEETIKKGPPESRDYFLGTWLGRVTNLLLLADASGLDTEREKLMEFLAPFFIKSLESFSYDKAKTSLIAEKPEFGNEKLNDHHFHYGYYIRAAAVLSKYNPQLLEKIKQPVQAMIDDIAMTDRDSTEYPFLRNFDIYEGHSWADGFAGFGDGNDQESSSEAMNAWYSVYLWGKTIDNKELQEYGLYLYNTEVQSTYLYWFNKNNLYKEPYNHAIASIVWGGKVDFATWFSGEANMVYGIQLLPFTPASGYLGNLPNFSKYDNDYHTSGGDETKPWGDLFVMWKSFYQPAEALAMKNKVQKLEDANSRSMFLYTLYKNAGE
jgi:endoglucanase Acf2